MANVFKQEVSVLLDDGVVVDRFCLGIKCFHGNCAEINKVV